MDDRTQSAATCHRPVEFQFAPEGLNCSATEGLNREIPKQRPLETGRRLEVYTDVQRHQANTIKIMYLLLLVH